MAKSKWTGKTLHKRYVMDEMLGQGGMSAVYKATDPNLKRVVAIKMIHPHLSDNPDFVKRFEEEASAVAQLRHPGIIQVYDFNREDDVYYMVLEFVPGETIQDHLKRLNESGRKLSIAKAMEYMANICDAVDYAHQRGLIHRDIKPANLMLNTLGQAILMDFGIAKIVGGQRHTATGAVVGTAMYMSPEQIRGEQPDRRTDIYSLGVTLFEMVSGHPPFEADSAMTLMMMHLNDPVPSLRNLNPDVPDELVAVINKALAKDPDERYQTAAQMAAALRNVMGRVKSGISSEAPAPKATMLESPMAPRGAQATTLEPPPASSLPYGTVVESGASLGVPAGAGRSEVGGTMVESTAAKSVPASSYAPSPSVRSKSSARSLPLIAGGIFIVVCLLVGGIFLLSQVFGNGNANATEPVIIPPVVDTVIPTLAFTLTPGPTDIVLPSETPTLAITSTPTVPPGPYVRINSITIDGDNYVINFETFEYTPQLPGMHVHFFYNTVSPQNAGSPGSGPWDLYGGPSPYTKFVVSRRPSAATQMCALVANPNHSLYSQTSGNCVDLP